MFATAEQARADPLQIVQEVREKLVRNPEALDALCFGVLRMKQNVYPRNVKLEVAADRESGDATSANLPEAEESSK